VSKRGDYGVHIADAHDLNPESRFVAFLALNVHEEEFDYVQKEVRETIKLLFFGAKCIFCLV
jgi:hypothetical protein